MLCAAAAAASSLSTVLTNYERCRSHRPYQRKHADNHRSTAVVLGWTTAQIADDLHIAERFVKARLQVALRALQRALELAEGCPGKDRS
jgi:DNA-binding NarL/FixJ family response regulator